MAQSYPGYVASYEIDHVNYGDDAPWPTEPDGSGPALIRIHTADYGNDVANWEASNIGGTPGTANLPLDTSAPTVPTNLAGQATHQPRRDHADLDGFDRQPELRRSLRRLPQRLGDRHFDDDLLQRYERAGRPRIIRTRSARSTATGSRAGNRRRTVGVPGIVSKDWPDNKHIEIYFSEPLNPATASV